MRLTRNMGSPYSPFCPPRPKSPNCPPHSKSLQIPKLPFTLISIKSISYLSISYQFPQIPPAKSQKKIPNSQELALPTEILEDSRNKGVVTALYEALSRRDAEAIQQILAPDLEWWFHGPPSHQFLMHLLTGGSSNKDSSSSSPEFSFVPHSVAAFGPTVLAEGFDPTRSIAWVHAWTVTDGIITQVREYFNTSLTVTRFSAQSDCSSIATLHCPSVWESSLPGRVGKSVPGLVLAI